MQITGTDVKVEVNRKVIYRKIHRYNKMDYLVEIGKAKTKYFIISIELNKKQRTQVLEVNLYESLSLIFQLHEKQAKKLIKNSGGIDAFADHLEFKFGKIVFKNMQEMLSQSIQPLNFLRYKDNRKVTINNESNEGKFL